MKHKKDLAKIALTAFVLASTAPMNAHVNDQLEAAGIFLAAGCPAHGCNAETPSNKSAQQTKNKEDAYSTRTDSYSIQSNSNTQSYPGNQSSTVSIPQDRYNSSTTQYRDRNINESVEETRRVTSKNVTSSHTLTEAQLLDLLNPQGKAIYLSLDSEGKALAIQLASQESYQDKTTAVKEAQRQMNERRGMKNR